jgi:hypothetical protein
MDTGILDKMTRGAAAMSRRGSLRSLGGAALGSALAAPALARAGKAGKKGQKRCQRQRGQCLAFVEEFCQPKGDPNACEAIVNPCCENFAQCNAGKGIECLVEKFLGAGGG